jgi:rhodanese-related sulfurtransferase
MNKSTFKDTLYDHFAQVGKALASGRRVEVLELLAQGPKTVEVVAEEARLSIANASQHLRVLKASGLVTSTKEGLFVTYRLAGPEVDGFLLAFRCLAEQRYAVIERLTRSFFAEAPEPMPLKELRRRLGRGEVVLLDVRPAAEFEEGHLPGALSVPLPQLELHLAALPKRKQLVAYCRGPYCVYAVEAVARLQAKGFRAKRLEEGVSEWRALGHPIETVN